jgi:hypothetical protein
LGKHEKAQHFNIECLHEHEGEVEDELNAEESLRPLTVPFGVEKLDRSPLGSLTALNFYWVLVRVLQKGALD